MKTELIITEAHRNSISTVCAYFITPTVNSPNGQVCIGDWWSCFNGDYTVGKEREFIAEIEAKNPGLYTSYHIGWSDSN